MLRRFVLASLVVAAFGCAPSAVATRAAPAVPAAPGSVHLALGEPRDADPSDDLRVDHAGFVLSYNARRLVPNWVAWRVVAEDLGRAPRSNDFHPDEELPPGTPGPRPHDYARSGYDRGHLCPSGDRTATEAANEETFVMTNMQPQRHALNVGPWEGLETYERTLAESGKQVFVVAGGLFDATPPTLAAGEAVPRANFKLVVALDRGLGPDDVTAATPVYAVIMPNSRDVAGTPWTQYLVTVDELERESGYDFLARVPTPIHGATEAPP